VLRTDREVIEHRPVLRDSGPVARIVTEGPRLPGSDHRRSGSTDTDAFCHRRLGYPGTKADQFVAQCRGISTGLGSHLDLTLGELVRHTVTQTCAGPCDNRLGGRARRATDRIDEKVFLFDADRFHNGHGGCVPNFTRGYS
jgi:hypothetical protein